MINPDVLRDVLAASGGGLPAIAWPLAVVALVLIGSALLRKRAKRECEGRGNGAALVGATPMAIHPLLNQSEARLFGQIDDLVRKTNGGHRLFAQVSLGKILKIEGGRSNRADRQSVFNMINAKRFDFLVVDRSWKPVVALEYHGKGHFQGDAKMRDEIKRAACRAAGLPLIEMSGAGLEDAQRQHLQRLLGLTPALAAE